MGIVYILFIMVILELINDGNFKSAGKTFAVFLFIVALQSGYWAGAIVTFFVGVLFFFVCKAIARFIMENPKEVMYGACYGAYRATRHTHSHTLKSESSRYNRHNCHKRRSR